MEQNNCVCKFGEWVYLLSKNLLKIILFESVFKMGDTSHLLVLHEYRCSYVSRIRNLKKLFRDSFIFNSVNNHVC